MLRQVLIAILLCGLSGGLCASAQQTIYNYCPYSQQHWNQLACLIPDLTKTGSSSNLSTFNTTLAEVLGQLPLAAPTTGFGLTLDKTLGVYVIPNESLGAILSERGDTVGKNHLFVGFTFQKFNFQAVDGTSLKNLPTVSALIVPGKSETYLYAQNYLSASVDQYVGVAAFGITSRIDVSVTVPFERVGLSAGYQNYSQTACNFVPACIPPPFSPAGPNNYLPGSASGIGDVILEGKGQIVAGEHLHVAAGAEVRFPTGNEYNLLGSGAYGFKPFLTVSRHGRFTPHANLGYQWNGTSPLYQSGGVNDNLPAWLEYSAGADISIVRRLTFVGDLLGQHFFNAPRVTPATVQTTPEGEPLLAANGIPVTSIGVRKGDYDADNLAVGLKANIWRNMIFSENIMVKLNDGGLRSKVTPLIGLSYRF